MKRSGEVVDGVDELVRNLEHREVTADIEPVYMSEVKC